MRRLRRLFEPARAPACFLYDGLTACGEPLRVLAAGIGAFRHYFSRAAFRRVTAPEALAPKEAADVLRLADDHAADLLLVSFKLADRVTDCRARGFILPTWISGSVRLSRDDIAVGHNYHRRRDIRIVRESGLSYEVTADPAALDRWYESMYLPLIDASHRDAALHMDRDDMLHRAKEGTAELVLINLGSDPVGGALVAYDDGRPRIWSRGILGADRDLQRRGVGAAIYLFSFDHLLNAGHDTVDIGRVRPFLRDSGLHYKKKNGFVLDGHTDPGFVLIDLAGSAASHAFFQQNPLVHIDGGQAAGIVVVSTGLASDEKALAKQLRYCELPGLDRMDVAEIPPRTVIAPDSVREFLRI